MAMAGRRSHRHEHRALPLQPLCRSRRSTAAPCLRGFTPRRYDHLLDGLNRYGFMILFALLMMPFRGSTLLAWIMWPAHIVGGFWLEHLFHWAIA